MKLRNKATGEVGTVYLTDNGVGVCIKEAMWSKEFNSLAELNEEWEDYEESHAWYINDRGYVVLDEGHFTSEGKEAVKSIGNYFGTKEEAEKAVEKLKAWKRLKDKGFKFKGWAETDAGKISIYTQYKHINDTRYFDQISHDLDLLFNEQEYLRKEVQRIVEENADYYDRFGGEE